MYFKSVYCQAHSTELHLLTLWATITPLLDVLQSTYHSTCSFSKHC